MLKINAKKQINYCLKQALWSEQSLMLELELELERINQCDKHRMLVAENKQINDCQKQALMIRATIKQC